MKVILPMLPILLPIGSVHLEALAGVGDHDTEVVRPVGSHFPPTQFPNEVHQGTHGSVLNSLFSLKSKNLKSAFSCVSKIAVSSQTPY